MDTSQLNNILRSSSSIYLLALFLLNPAVWFFNLRISGAFPDTTGYLVLADTIFQNGKLLVEHWGHIDSGLILPPVYPSLISMGNYFSNDSLWNAQLVSLSLILLSIFPLFFFLARHTTRTIAFFSVLIIQLNFYYALYGFAALTEATFIFMLATGLWLTGKALNEEKISHLFLLGIVASLVFLTRQIGGVFLIFSCLLFLSPVLKKGSERGKAVRNTLIIMAGFLVVMMPYSLALYGQSGQHPFTQGFRLLEYSVPETAVPAQKVSLEGLGNQNPYYQTWVKRRIARQLIPDASEMYAFLTPAQDNDSLVSVLTEKGDIKILAQNTVNNFNYLKEATGLPLLLLFILIPLSICCVKNKDVPVKIRLILPGFILLYGIIVTFLSGSVGRYIDVLFPFILMSVLMEAYFTFRAIIKRETGFFRPEIMTILLCIPVFFSTPKYFTSHTFNEYTDEHAASLRECGKFIKTNDPVFSIHRNDVYLLGGNYRTLPNDSLKRISMYAEKTNVKWLLQVDSDVNRYELEHYFLADWKNKPYNLHETHPEHVSLACVNSENNVFLYKFLRNASG